ncbi:MAG: L-Ala-D/L-Glu epimerase [Solirubrobacteraceae bacterium]|nr:L-Ala-D/L-Glu epimerase [Solirubrobacteraceae bacterium]
MRLTIHTVQVPLRTPFVSATSSVEVRGLLGVELEGADGVTGYGEAAPLESYDGVSLDAARAAIEDCRDVLEDADGTDIDGLLTACWSRAVLPQAMAGIDLALWDLAGRRADLPVWRLLGGDEPGPVAVNATIAAADRAGAATQAADAVAAGFTCLKVKVGLGDDGPRLAAIRAVAGASTAIRIDANGVWSVEEALASLRLLQPVGIELCEEPVSGLGANREVSVTAPVATAIDESAALPGALDVRASTAVCLKITRCGGISGLLWAATRARRAGYEVYLASTLDGPRGIAAALHAAAAVRPDRPCGLATLSLFADTAETLPIRRGAMALPAGPGLGDGLVLRARSA